MMNKLKPHLNGDNMKYCPINPAKSQTKIVKIECDDIKLKLWEVIEHPVTFVEPKEEVIKECRLRSIQLKSGRYAYSLGLPVFGIMYYSQWYTL